MGCRSVDNATSFRFSTSNDFTHTPHPGCQGAPAGALYYILDVLTLSGHHLVHRPINGLYYITWPREGMASGVRKCGQHKQISESLTHPLRRVPLCRRGDRRG